MFTFPVRHLSFVARRSEKTMEIVCLAEGRGSKDQGRKKQVEQIPVSSNWLSAPPVLPIHSSVRQWSRWSGKRGGRVGRRPVFPVPGNGHDGGFGYPRRLNPFANRCQSLPPGFMCPRVGFELSFSRPPRGGFGVNGRVNNCPLGGQFPCSGLFPPTVQPPARAVGG